MSDSRQLLFVFPGQGSQYLGMGKDLRDAYPVARSVYDRAGEVLGYDLAALCVEGPEDRLNLTRFTQPALLTHHIACLEVFGELTGGRVRPDLAAGHSLGEYSALVAAGTLDFESALRLVQRRGELMGEHGEGEMSAFPLDSDSLKPIAERFHCAVAGCNLPDQTVIGGRAGDLEQVEAAVAEAFPRKRAFRLKTEGAFHTYHMVTAARHFRAGGFHSGDPGEIRARLFFQLFHPVLWHANLLTAVTAGVGRIVEFGGGIGPGEPDAKRPNLEGMIKKGLRGGEIEIDYLPAINRQTIEAAAAGL